MQMKYPFDEGFSIPIIHKWTDGCLKILDVEWKQIMMQSSVEDMLTREIQSASNINILGR